VVCICNLLYIVEKVVDFQKSLSCSSWLK